MAETDEGAGRTTGRRSAAERIAVLRVREEQLKARPQALEARTRQAERKRRTRQLIQLGGVLAAWGFDTPEQVEATLREATATVAGRRRLATHGVGRTGRWPAKN